MNITIQCDRCKNFIDGMQITASNGIPQITAGFYDVSDGFWKTFAKEGESKICDSCMFGDPNYNRTYSIGNE